MFEPAGDDRRDEARATLARALCRHRRLVVRRECLTCGAASDRRIAYDSCLDPLGLGAELPPGFVDRGADLVLFTGRPTRQVAIFLDRKDNDDDEREGLDVHVAVPEDVSFWPSILSDGIVLVDGQRPVERCADPNCLTLMELAGRLGIVSERNTDDVDWDRPNPDLTQYVANASTGRFRIRRQWRPDVPYRFDDDRLWDDFERRSTCPRCDRRCNTLSRHKSLCAECVTALSQTGCDESETRPLPAEEREARNANLRWLRSVRHVRRPAYPHGDNPETRGDVENEHPCVRCARITYKPVFWYGYRSICSTCLAPEFADRINPAPTSPNPDPQEREARQGNRVAWRGMDPQQKEAVAMRWGERNSQHRDDSKRASHTAAASRATTAGGPTRATTAGGAAPTRDAGDWGPPRATIAAHRPGAANAGAAPRASTAAADPPRPAAEGSERRPHRRWDPDDSKRPGDMDLD